MKGYIFLLIFITVLVYLNSFGNDFVWDDVNNIVQNKELDKPLGIREVFLNPGGSQIFYRPIPYLTIWLDWHFWRENPAGYHLTNLIFHLACVCLVFFLCQKLVHSKSLSFLAVKESIKYFPLQQLGLLRGAIWRYSGHPCSSTGRDRERSDRKRGEAPLKEVRSPERSRGTTSFLAALIFAIHPVHTEAVTYISGRSDLICGFFIFLSFWLYLNFLDNVNKRAFYLCGALFSFSMALFSKEIALIFPIVIFFHNLYLNKKFQGATLLFLLFAIGYLLFRYLFVILQPLQLSLGKVYYFPAILVFYIRLLVFPFNLHMQHSLDMSLFISSIILLVIVFIALRFIRDKFLRFGMTWFVLWLMPFLGFLKFNSDMAEHWLYISSFGFFLIICSLIRNRFVFSSIILFLFCLTIQRNIVWRDDVSIYKDTLRYNPQDIRLHYNLGNAYLRKGLLSEAACEYMIALKERPDYAYALNNLRLVKERQKAFRFNLSASVFADEEYFDHSLYAEVLDKFVKDGIVDYAGLKKESRLLTAYLEKVAGLDFNSLSREDKIALYINVYNAFTLKLITEHYPIKSIKDIPGVWDKFKVRIAGREFSLNQIEHDILRKEFKEPRIHFALVCASKGCPKLAKEPFNGINLEEQLDGEANRFINDKDKVRLDKEKGILYLSSIFKWFKEDFGDPVKFAEKYLSEEEKKWVSVKYLPYDWSLNE